MRYHLIKKLRWPGARYKMLVHRDHRMMYFEDETLLGEILEVLERPWYRRLIRWPWLSWEIEADHKEIGYYYWAPNEQIGNEIRKKILGQHPEMEITYVINGAETVNQSGGFVTGSSMRLDKHYVVPIKSFYNETIDSQSAIVNTISDLAEGEKCLIQILFQPAKKYQKKFDKAINLVKKWDVEKEFKKIELFETNIYGKQTKQLADCQIRIMTIAKEKTKARKILSEVQRSFGQFTSEALNALKPRERWMHLKPLHLYNIRNRLFSMNRLKSRQLILNIEELSGLARLPSEKVNITRLHRLLMKSVEVPVGVLEISEHVKKSGVGMNYINIGTNNFRMKQTPVYLDIEKLRQHMLVFGGSGQGKTVFLTNLILSMCDLKCQGMPFGFFLIDPLGGLAQEVGSNIPDELLPYVNYVQPDPLAQIHFPYNLFDVDFSTTEHSIAKNIADAVSRIWPENWGPRPEKNFLHGGIALQRYGEASIINLEKLLRSGTYAGTVAQYLDRQPDFNEQPIIEFLMQLWKWESNAFDQRRKAELTESTLNKLDHFTLSPLLKGAMGAKTCGFRWLESMNKGYINILDLSKIQNEHEKRMYGSMAMTMNYQAAISRSSTEDNLLYPLFIDEFPTFIEANLEVVNEMADKTRQKNVPIVGAAQGLVTQLEKSVADAIARNFNNQIAFRINHSDDAFFIERHFNDPNLLAGDFQKTPETFAYARINVGRSSSPPFSLQTVAPKYEPVNPEKIQRLIDLSIERAMHREKVEKKKQHDKSMTVEIEIETFLDHSKSATELIDKPELGLVSTGDQDNNDQFDKEDVEDGELFVVPGQALDEIAVSAIEEEIDSNPEPSQDDESTPTSIEASEHATVNDTEDEEVIQVNLGAIGGKKSKKKTPENSEARKGSSNGWTFD